MTFDELYDIFQKQFGATKLSDIAVEFDVSPQVVSNWKIRNQVPYKYVVLLRNKVANNSVNEPQKAYIIENSQQLNDDFDEDDFDFKSFILIFIRTIKLNLKLILSITFACVFIVFINVQFFSKPVYESSAKIIAIGSSSPKSGFSGIAGQLGINLSSGSSNMKLSEVFPDILKSNLLAYSLMDKRFDTKKFGKNLTLLEIYKRRMNLNVDERTLKVIVAEKISRGLIKVKKDRIGPLLQITINEFEPKFCADLTNSVIKELILVVNKLKNSKNSEKLSFIQQRLNEVTKDLNNSEEILKKFRESNKNIFQSPALLLEQERLVREVNVKDNIFVTLKQEYELLQVEMVGGENNIMIIDPPIIPISRISPRKKESIIFAFIFGLFFSLVLAFLKDNFDYKSFLKNI